MSFFPIVDADASNKGLIQLAGDLSGTASSPSVPALSQKLDASEKGAADGVATLDSGGKLPATQLNVTFPVTSVAGQTGDVALAKSDVGLANVDNTSDANKPVSTATQAVLAGKAAVSHTHTATQISDSTAVGQAVMTATDEAAAQLALGIANTVQVVDSFASVTSPVYGTLYVVRA